MQATSVSTLSIAISSAMLLLVACTDGSMRRLGDGFDAEPSDDGGSQSDTGGSGGSGTGASGGSDNPGPQCMGAETQCGTVCCPNQTHVCNGGVCEPSAETCQYGSTCATGKVCNSAGECQNGCFINNTLYSRGVKNPSNQCESCEAASTTAWTPSAAEGTGCGGGRFCNASGKCGAGCSIGGHVYSIDQRSPSGTCEVCSGSNSTGWSMALAGAECSDGGTVCRFDGECVKAMPVAAGEYHTCGVTPAGRAMCWGKNEYGQLGTGGSDSLIPVGVSGLGSGVIGIGAGLTHGCAIKASGQVVCWGDNNYGQIGVGTSVSQYATPQLVDGLPSEVVSIALGGAHTCAVLVDGTAMCWGYNASGQLGDTTTSTRRYPVAVVGLPSAVVSLTAGYVNTCAILEDSSLWCWGYNAFGQLGDGTSAPSTIPVRPKNLGENMVSVACGAYHTCAVDTDGIVKCWGNNADGQCGRAGGGEFSEAGPSVAGLALNVIGVSAGYDYSCAWTEDGLSMCWGSNSVGQLGDNNAVLKRHTAELVYGLGTGVAGLSKISLRHLCATMASGKVRCWGYNPYGAIGDGSVGSPHPVPTELTMFP